MPGINLSFNTISSNVRFTNVNDNIELEILDKNTYYQNNFNFDNIGIPLIIQFRMQPNKKNINFIFETGINTGFNNVGFGFGIYL